MTIRSVEITNISLDAIDLHVQIAEAGFFGDEKLKESRQTIAFSRGGYFCSLVVDQPYQHRS